MFTSAEGKFYAVMVALIALFAWAPPLLAEPAAVTPKEPGTVASESLSMEDWADVIKTYEGQISQGRPTAAALHNLALARFKHGEPEQAVAVWLAAWERDESEPEIRAGLFGALTSLGWNETALDLSAQGPWIEFVAAMGRGVFHGVLAAGVVVFAAMAAAVVFIRGWPRLRISLIVASICLWSVVGFWYVSLGQWGAVVDSREAVVRSTAGANGPEISRLKPGCPVYVTSNSFEPWLYVRTADGYAGWVDALSLRLVR